MNDPLISVIIPVWNRPEFLRMSVMSVLQQTYENFELIIVDDGSDDSTFEVAMSLMEEDKRVRAISKEHSGATDTLNMGVQKMKGDVFCLLGSDDLWLENKLEEQVKKHIEFPDYVLHTESKRIQVDGSPQEDIYLSDLLGELGGTTPDLFLKRHIEKPYAAFFGSSLFVPKYVLDKVGLFPGTVGNDYHWVLNAALLHNVPFTLIPKHLIKNRTNPRSTTGENYKYILEEAVHIWEDVKGKMK